MAAKPAFRVYLSRASAVPEVGKPHEKCADAMREFMKTIRVCVERNIGVSIALEQLSDGRWSVLRRVSTVQIGRSHAADGQFDPGKFHYDNRDRRTM